MLAALSRREMSKRMWLVEVMHSPLWAGILAALASAGLLVAFHQVVDEAVRQGELRRVATATHVEAMWRCNALGGRSAVARQNCLLELNPTRDVSAHYE